MVRLPPPLRPLFPYLKPWYSRATGVVAPATQRLSRARGGSLPTGVVSTLAEGAARSNGRSAVARPAETISRVGPMVGLPAHLPLSDPSDGEHVAAVTVAELPDGRVLGPHRAIVTGGGDLVHEASWYFGTRRPRQHPLFLNPFVDPPVHVEGRVGVLCARADYNYYHFMIDALPRLGVLDHTAIPAPERWYVPVETRFQAELLDMLGITRDQRVDAAEHPHIRADVLVVPGQPAMSEKNPPWVVEWLRARLLNQVDIGGPRRRIWVTRGTAANNRAVLNEDAVTAMLAARGFEIVDPGAMSVADQIATFATADLIVAPHGAALTNLVFASPGAAVVEVFPAGCLLPDFWRLACGVPGLRYRYLSAPGGPRRPTRNVTIVRDIEVDLSALGRLLDDLESGAG